MDPMRFLRLRFLQLPFLPSSARVLVAVLLYFGSTQGAVNAQEFLVPQTQAVEYRGKIAALNPQTRIVTIETELGSVFALTHPTRRTSDRQIIGGIPPARTRLTAYESPRTLRQGMFIQIRAKVGPRNTVLEPVSDIRVVGNLPLNGFSIAPNFNDQPIPAIEPGAGGGLGPDMDLIRDLRERLPPEMLDRLGDAGGGEAGGGDADGGEADEAAGDGAADDGAADDGAADDGAADDGAAADIDDELEDAGEGLGLTQWMFVSGQVASAGRNQISMLVPVNGRKQRVRFELAEDSLLLLQTDDMSLAEIGDPIHAIGEAIELPRFFATELVVTHVSDDLSEQALARLDERGRLIAPGTAEDKRVGPDAGIGGRGGDAAGVGDVARGGDDRGGGDRGDGGAPVDPFEIVKRERQAREQEAAENNSAPAAERKAGSVFHGRIIKIN